MDAQLARLHGTMVRADVATEMGVSDSAVRARVTRLGLAKVDNWSAAEGKKLKQAYESVGGRDYLDLGALASDLGRTKVAVCIKARKLGLPTCNTRYKVEESLYRDGSRPSQAKYSDDERRDVRSKRLSERHATRGHPMLGKKHSKKTRKVISQKGRDRWASMTESERESFSTKCAKAQAASTKISTKREKASWKAGWREIGGKRCYFRSRWEANYARYLEWLKGRGEILDWEFEPETFWFEKIKRGVRSYKPDFRVFECDGSSKLHEVKGWMCPRSKTTLKRMAKYYPDHPITLIDAKAYRALERSVAPIIEGWEA